MAAKAKAEENTTAPADKKRNHPEARWFVGQKITGEKVSELMENKEDTWLLTEVKGHKTADSVKKMLINADEDDFADGEYSIFMMKNPGGQEVSLVTEKISRRVAK